MNILVLNGPNLNLLGQRETHIYGRQTLGDIEALMRKHAQRDVRLDFFQSNMEGELIDQLQKAPRKYQGVIFNPGGYSHTSVALRDSISAISLPVIEVHLSNIHAREEFRRHSITGGACAGVITGLGVFGYLAALDAVTALVGREGTRAPEPARREPTPPPPPREAPREAPRELPREAPAADDDRDASGKRRRRGRRGGRSRRREDEPLEEGQTEQDESDEGTEETRPSIDIEAKYAHLKGATVRRGLDVLAEDGETVQPKRPVGQVTFTDEGQGRGAGATAVPVKRDNELRVVPPAAQPKPVAPAAAPAAPKPVAAPVASEDSPIRRTRTTGTRRREEEATPAAPVVEIKEAPRTPAEPVTPSPIEAEGESESKLPAKKASRKKAAKKSAPRKSAPRKRAAKAPEGEDGQ